MLSSLRMSENASTAKMSLSADPSTFQSPVHPTPATVALIHCIAQCYAKHRVICFRIDENITSEHLANMIGCNMLCA